MNCAAWEVTHVPFLTYTPLPTATATDPVGLLAVPNNSLKSVLAAGAGAGVVAPPRGINQVTANGGSLPSAPISSARTTQKDGNALTVPSQTVSVPSLVRSWQFPAKAVTLFSAEGALRREQCRTAVCICCVSLCVCVWCVYGCVTVPSTARQRRGCLKSRQRGEDKNQGGRASERGIDTKYSC
jgi:hypothetical protein